MVDVVSASVPTARKRHFCDSCCGAIELGQRYHRTFCVDGGEAWTYREHEDCWRACSIIHDMGWHEEWPRVCDFEPEERDDVRAADAALADRLWPARAARDERTER